MEKLIVLKQVTSEVYASLMNDSRTDLILALGPVFKKPLVRFEEAYDAFIEEVVKQSSTFDRWLNVQMDFVTRMGNDQGAFKQLEELFKEVLKGTPGGETATFDETSFEAKGFMIVLAFRVYLDTLTFGVVQPQEGAKK